jgi:hypothetical protein
MEHIYKLCTINQIADIILNPLAVNNKGLLIPLISLKNVLLVGTTSGRWQVHLVTMGFILS